MTRKKDEDLTPEQARLIARVKKLMAIPLLIMVAGFLTVFGVIAYRLYFKTPSAKPAIERVLILQRGSKVVSTTVNDGKLIVTVETGGGTTEVLLFDLPSMQASGRFIIKTP